MDKQAPTTMYPCIWFDSQASEAARFYCSVFEQAAIQSENPIVTILEIGGHKFMLLNGGPRFHPNPTLSFYVICETPAEIAAVWEKLATGGTIMMPLQAYEWSQQYGWVQDRYGVSWQLTLGSIAENGQKIIPALMYVGEQFGQAEAALNLYTGIFPDSAIHFLHRYDDTDALQKGKIAHGQFSLLGQKFILMDSGLSHDFAFTEGLSLVVECKDQAEIDHYWYKLSEEGYEDQCGWLKDRFGFSWQVVPAILGELMSDPVRSGPVTQAFLKMKKFNISQLLQA